MKNAEDRKGRVGGGGEQGGAAFCTVREGPAAQGEPPEPGPQSPERGAAGTGAERGPLLTALPPLPSPPASGTATGASRPRPRPSSRPSWPRSSPRPATTLRRPGTATSRSSWATRTAPAPCTPSTCSPPCSRCGGRGAHRLQGARVRLPLLSSGLPHPPALTEAGLPRLCFPRTLSRPRPSPLVLPFHVAYPRPTGPLNLPLAHPPSHLCQVQGHCLLPPREARPAQSTVSPRGELETKAPPQGLRPGCGGRGQAGSVPGRAPGRRAHPAPRSRPLGACSAPPQTRNHRGNKETQGRDCCPAWLVFRVFGRADSSVSLSCSELVLSKFRPVLAGAGGGRREACSLRAPPRPVSAAGTAAWGPRSAASPRRQAPGRATAVGTRASAA